MKAIKIFTIGVIGAMFIASCSNTTATKDPQPKGISKADIDSVSYLVGMWLGGIEKQQGFGDLNNSKIFEGMKAALAGEELDQELFMRKLNSFMEERTNLLKAENIEKGAAFFEENAKKDSVQRTESGIQYKIVRTGNGVKPQGIDTVEVNYEGTGIFSGKVFDSSFERGHSVTFPLTGVIPGWTEGIQLLDEGGEIILWIPAELAYGENGIPQAGIGPNEPLMFKVELIKVKPAQPAAEEEAK